MKHSNIFCPLLNYRPNNNIIIDKYKKNTNQVNRQIFPRIQKKIKSYKIFKNLQKTHSYFLEIYNKKLERMKNLST